jgi:hypothetical protein
MIVGILVTIALTVTCCLAVILHPVAPRTAVAVGQVPPVQEAAMQLPAAAPLVSAPVVRPLALPRLHHFVVPTLLVSAARPLTATQLSAIRALPGVRRTQPLVVGHVGIAGHRALAVGADPRTFRMWTPKLTADSRRLWDGVEDGDLVTSFDLGENARLPLGADLPVTSPRGFMPLRLGALASLGLAGVDALLSETQARGVGLRPRTGLLISAPRVDALTLRQAVLHALGGDGRVGVLNELVVTRDAGEYLTRLQIATFLQSAASRVGMPYVWGAAGPDSFDCSGLVQWAFAQAGIQMPRVAQDQFFTGPHISYADAQPGDLLFWHYEPDDPTYVSHVAIYVGDGEMLVAPHTGEDVMLAPVPLPDMAGVVRVDPAVAAQVG